MNSASYTCPVRVADATAGGGTMGRKKVPENVKKIKERAKMPGF